MSDCYLIADEVGLGKTRIACSIACEIGRRDGYLRMLYLACSQRIADKNVIEFSGRVKASWEANSADLAQYQKEAAQAALENLCGGIVEDETEEFEVGVIDKNRLSMLYGDKIGNCVISITHQNNFDGRVLDTRSIAADEKKKLIKTLSLQWGSVAKVADLDDELQRAIAFECGEALRNGTKRVVAQVSGLDLPQTTVREALRKISGGYGELFEATEEQMLARRIVIHAFLLKHQVNVIVLDEFQKFWESLPLIATEQRFLREQNAKLPKLILLSATPLKDGVKLYTDDRGVSGELPALLRGLGADVSAISCCLNRTERGFFFREEDRKLYRERVYVNESQAVGQVRYMTKLLRIFADKGMPSLVCKLLSEMPNYWRFNYDYNGESFGLEMRKYLEQCRDEEKLEKFRAAEETVYENVSLKMCIANSLPCKEPGGDLDYGKMLWILPSEFHYLKDAYGKTLAFATYKATPRAAAYYLNRYVLEQCGVEAGGFSDKENLKNGDIKLEKIMEWVEKMLRAENQSRNGTEKLSEDGIKEKMNTLLEGIVSFFNTPYAKAVVRGAYSDEAQSYGELVGRYCEEYRLQEVLSEYYYVYPFQVERNKADFASFCDYVKEVMSGTDFGNIRLAPIGAGDAHQSEKDCEELIFTSFYTDDKNQNEGHDRSFIKKVTSRFNSPFYPMVMFATETAQEGLDFHFYADRMIHLSLPASASGFIQREGRIDRPNSLVVRRRFAEMWKKWKESRVDDEETVEFSFPYIKENAHRMLLDIHSRENVPYAITLSHEAGIFPQWFVPVFSDETSAIQRIMCGTEFGGKKEKETGIQQRSDSYFYLEGQDETNDDKKERICAFFKNRAGMK